MFKITSLLLSLSLIASFFSGTAYAKSDPEIPEVSGIYRDPGNPGLMVRVFVHKEKPAERPGKPSPDPTPAPQCVATTDPDSQAITDWAGWVLPSSWTYHLNPSSVPSSVGGNNLDEMASDAFGQWTNASGVNFNLGSDTTISRQAYDGVNVVAWGRTSGDALGVTYVRYYPSTGEVVDVDTIMNKKFPWRWSNDNLCAYPNAYDAENILTHELGHWLGLDDHYTSEYVNNTMYGYGSKGEVKKDTLTTGDINGAGAIY